MLLLTLVTLVGIPVMAQQSLAEAAAKTRNSRQAATANGASREQVMTLLDLMQVRRNLVVALGNMKQIMKQGAEQSFRGKIPNPTPKQLEALRGMIDDIDVPLDDMMDAIVPIYQRHFTTSDVEDLIRFYSSPVGQKLLTEQPQMLQESMQAGAAIQQKRMDEIMAKIDLRIKALIESAGESGETPKK
jgi:hypothetical protein